MTTEILGYTAQTSESKNIAYILTGKRGARYRLVRHVNHPETMFAVNSSGNVVCLQGNYTFTDRGGCLTTLNPGT